MASGNGNGLISGRPVVLLRGDQLRPSAVSLPAPSMSAQTTETSNPRFDGESIYGVPVSAIQHCCGRGCKHCRIYWNRLKP